MNCSDFEILLCDYLDGTLAPEQRRSVEAHRDACPACAELARDVVGVTAFIERAAAVEPPPGRAQTDGLETISASGASASGLTSNSGLSERSHGPSGFSAVMT